MRTNEKDNLFLIDKDYEIWGIEEEELIGTLVVSLLVCLPLSVVSLFLLALSPLVWFVLLILLKNYKSKQNVRGRIKRKLVVKAEELLFGRRRYYA